MTRRLRLVLEIWLKLRKLEEMFREKIEITVGIQSSYDEIGIPGWIIKGEPSTRYPDSREERQIVQKLLFGLARMWMR